jgi:Ca2+-binding EF-hand superfamily protein
MPSSKYPTQALGVVALGLSLACGGGGGSSSTEAPSASLSKVQTGTFIDSPVKGLRYQTTSLEGSTDGEGRFYYREGEEVTFKLGSTLLGKASGGNTITPAHLFGVANNSEDRRLVNALRLLQTLDADGNPDNGIDIAEAFTSLSEKFGLNFDQDPTEFSFSDNILQLLQKSPRALVDGDQAVRHFNNTLTRQERPGADDLERPLEFASASEFLNARDIDLSGDLNMEEFVRSASSNQQILWSQCFNKLDSNQDGSLSSEEFSAKPEPQIELTQESVTELEKQQKIQADFSVIDVDGSGRIDATEWLNAHIEHYALRQQEAFGRLDTDLNARLSLSELEAKPQHDSAEHHAEVFAKLDLDADGSISLEEFILNVPEANVELAKAAFGSMDSNSDGFLALEELRVNPKKDAKVRRATAFAQQDADSSGALSLDEFLAKVPVEHVAKATEHFSQLDIDFSGDLSEDEMSGMARMRKDR